MRCTAERKNIENLLFCLSAQINSTLAFVPLIQFKRTEIRTSIGGDPAVSNQLIANAEQRPIKQLHQTIWNFEGKSWHTTLPTSGKCKTSSCTDRPIRSGYCPAYHKQGRKDPRICFLCGKKRLKKGFTRGDFLRRAGSFLVKRVRCDTAAVNPEKVSSIFPYKYGYIWVFDAGI